MFASEFENDIGLLNKAALVPGPWLDFDLDGVVPLDDFDFDDPKLGLFHLFLSPVTKTILAAAL